METHLLLRFCPILKAVSRSASGSGILLSTILCSICQLPLDNFLNTNTSNGCSVLLIASVLSPGRCKANFNESACCDFPRNGDIGILEASEIIASSSISGILTSLSSS